MFRWLRHQRVVDHDRQVEIDRLKQELDDERATIVVVACAVEPACRKTIKELTTEIDLLRSQLGDGL